MQVLMAAGETVVMYDPANRLYHLGVIKGPCTLVSDVDSITYTRAVKWAKTAPRDVLTPSSKNSLGGIQAILAVSGEVWLTFRRLHLQNSRRRQT